MHQIVDLPCGRGPMIEKLLGRIFSYHLTLSMRTPEVFGVAVPSKRRLPSRGSGLRIHLSPALTEEIYRLCGCSTCWFVAVSLFGLSCCEAGWGLSPKPDGPTARGLWLPKNSSFNYHELLTVDSPGSTQGTGCANTR